MDVNEELKFLENSKKKKLGVDVIVRLMTSISKGKNTPIVLKDKISLILKLINYAIFFRLSSLPKSVASYCKKGR